MKYGLLKDKFRDKYLVVEYVTPYYIWLIYIVCTMKNYL